MTTFAQITDVGDVTHDSATVTFDNYVPLEWDVGKILRIEGDSVPYTITSKSGAATVTVSPVVQRADGVAIALDIEPAPLPLMWFDQAPSAQTSVLLSYYAKPAYLWTDDQRTELGDDWDMAFHALANYRIVSAYSNDKLRREEAMSNLKMALDLLPSRVDAAPLIKFANQDVMDYPQSTFPRVGGLAT
jgi:hypothetical protein